MSTHKEPFKPQQPQQATLSEDHTPTVEDYESSTLQVKSVSNVDKRNAIDNVRAEQAIHISPESKF